MKTLRLLPLCLLLFIPATAQAELCQGFGPQTPRDIASATGTNPVIFPAAPAHDHLNLCNIHFHKQAEHKGPGFSIFAGEGEFGGYQCNETPKLTEAQLKGDAVCENVKPGDTIEVHWVHSSCDVAPGPGLGSCLSDACANPSLRVETQVFLVVNDAGALDFGDFAYGGEKNGYHQAKGVPSGTGDPVQFLGSTTGPSFTQETCSPLQVTWSVRPQCAMVDIASLARWCDGDNVFEEKKGHGVRALVTAPELLSQID